MEKEDNIGISLVDTIGSSEASSVLQELAEVAIDSLLKDGLLKDIPVVSSVIGLSKTAIAVKDFILIQKILAFLKETSDISKEERDKFIHDIDGNVNYKRKIGEHLIMLLDRLDDMSKPEMVAKIFKSYLKDNLTFNEFKRFSSIIDRIFVDDLAALLEALSGDVPRMRHPFAEKIYHLGLSEIWFDDSDFQKVKGGLDNQTLGFLDTFMNNSKEPIRFRLSENAYILAQIVLAKKIFGKDYVNQYCQARDNRID